jgi:hypothetical protein
VTFAACRRLDCPYVADSAQPRRPTREQSTALANMPRDGLPWTRQEGPCVRRNRIIVRSVFAPWSLFVVYHRVGCSSVLECFLWPVLEWGVSVFSTSHESKAQSLSSLDASRVQYVYLHIRGSHAPLFQRSVRFAAHESSSEFRRRRPPAAPLFRGTVVLGNPRGRWVLARFAFREVRISSVAGMSCVYGTAQTVKIDGVW